MVCLVRSDGVQELLFPTSVVRDATSHFYVWYRAVEPFRPSSKGRSSTLGRSDAMSDFRARYHAVDDGPEHPLSADPGARPSPIMRWR